MEAAMRVFGSTGYNEAKIADIAAEAGVATGTLYNYFSSKEEIFESILEDGRERVWAHLSESESISDPLERLRDAIGRMLGFLEEHGALFVIYTQIIADPHSLLRPGIQTDDEFRRALVTLFETSLAAASARLRPDLPHETLAVALSGLIHGFIMRWVEGGCRPGLRAQTDLIFDIFMNGARSR